MSGSSRIPDLARLSSKERLLLAERAEVLCIQRLQAIADALVDSDALEHELRAMVEDERRHLTALRAATEATDWPVVWHMDEPAIDRILAHHLPATANGIVGAMRREELVDYVRAMEAEAARFYEELAAADSAEELRRLFGNLAFGERRHAEAHGFA